MQPPAKGNTNAGNGIPSNITGSQGGPPGQTARMGSKGITLSTPPSSTHPPLTPVNFAPAGMPPSYMDSGIGLQAGGQELSPRTMSLVPVHSQDVLSLGGSQQKNVSPARGL